MWVGKGRNLPAELLLQLAPALDNFVPRRGRRKDIELSMATAVRATLYATGMYVGDLTPRQHRPRAFARARQPAAGAPDEPGRDVQRRGEAMTRQYG